MCLGTTAPQCGGTKASLIRQHIPTLPIPAAIPAGISPPSGRCPAPISRAWWELPLHYMHSYHVTGCTCVHALMLTHCCPLSSSHPEGGKLWQLRTYLLRNLQRGEKKEKANQNPSTCPHPLQLQGAQDRAQAGKAGGKGFLEDWGARSRQDWQG